MFFNGHIHNVVSTLLNVPYIDVVNDNFVSTFKSTLSNSNVVQVATSYQPNNNIEMFVTHLYSSRFCESDFKQKYFRLNQTKFSMSAIRQVLWLEKKHIPSKYLFKIKLNIDIFFGKLKLTSSNSFCPPNSTDIFLFAISFYVVDSVNKQCHILCFQNVLDYQTKMVFYWLPAIVCKI